MNSNILFSHEISLDKFYFDKRIQQLLWVWMLLMSKESGFEIQFRISLNQKLDLPVFEDWYSLIRIARL